MLAETEGLTLIPHGMGLKRKYVFALNGIEGIVTASSMNNVHSCEEYTNVTEMEKVSEILVELVTQKKGKNI